MAKLLVWAIQGYKTYISPLLGKRCRFAPTCSEYAMEAIQLHGAGKGMLLALWRILLFNPLGKRGYDPVPPKGSWRHEGRRLFR